MFSKSKGSWDELAAIADTPMAMRSKISANNAAVFDDMMDKIEIAEGCEKTREMHQVCLNRVAEFVMTRSLFRALKPNETSRGELLQKATKIMGSLAGTTCTQPTLPAKLSLMVKGDEAQGKA